MRIDRLGMLLTTFFLSGLLMWAAPTHAEPIEVQWWYGLTGELGKRVEEVADKFNQSQNKYRVVAVYKGNYEEVLNGTVAAYRAHRQPHLVQIYERGVMTMLLSGAVVPIQEMMAKYGKDIDWSAIIKPVAGFYQYKGKLVSMPFNSSTPVLWYNPDYFKKAGFDKPADTWEEFDKQIYAIKKKGIAECGTTFFDYWWTLMENYGAVNDIPYATRSNGLDGLDTQFVYNKTKVVEQVTRLKRWVDDGVLQIAGQGVSPAQLFTSGKCASIFGTSAWQAGISADAKIPFTATYLPHNQGVDPRNSTIGGASLWVLKGHKPKEYEAIAAFFAFLSEPELQVWWHKVTGYVPLTTTAYELAKNEGYYEKNPAREIAILQLSRGTPTRNSIGFRFGNYTQTTFALREEIEAMFAGKKTPQQALDDAVRRGNEILRDYEKLHAGQY